MEPHEFVLERLEYHRAKLNSARAAHQARPDRWTKVELNRWLAAFGTNMLTLEDLLRQSTLDPAVRAELEVTWRDADKDGQLAIVADRN